jgi:RimJ/RimL family protein N-acetyltransferase
MDFPKTLLPSLGLPRDFQTKKGVSLRLELLGEEFHQRLVEMYLAFQPRGVFQELPPLKDGVCVQWVHGMVNTGINMVAISGNEDIVGHAALFPINDEGCEVFMMIRPEYQDMGIGMEMMRLGIQAACEMGFEWIWLSVDARNARARHVYRKCGFEYVSDQQAHQIDMVCHPTRMRTLTATPPSQRFSEP